MAISPKHAKILWANAAGICSFPNCNLKLCTDQTSDTLPHTTGQMAHIEGDKKGSNRYNPEMSDTDRNSFLNLILMCSHHHTVIDQKENEHVYTIKKLHKMKEVHFEKIFKNYNSSMFTTKEEVLSYITPLHIENHTAFQTYGPVSEFAKDGQNIEAFETWKLLRLTVISVNNQIIEEITREYIKLFDKPEQEILNKFWLHSSSYAKWVSSEINYASVIRYPTKFLQLLEKT